MQVILLLELVWCIVVVALIGLVWPSATTRRKEVLKKAPLQVRRI
jgi:hypothetical protein